MFEESFSNTCFVAIGLVAKMMVLSFPPDTPLSAPKMYHFCGFPSLFLPNTSLPTVSAVPLEFGLNVSSINWAFVAYAVTLGDLVVPSAAFTLTVAPGNAGTNPANRAAVSATAVPFLNLFLIAFIIFLLSLIYNAYASCRLPQGLQQVLLR